MSRVDKPALLRRLFQLGCHYSGQILSYQKMLGQLQEAGNTTTLAHYLELLTGAGMLTGLQKYAGQTVRQRGSSPKLQVLNNALMTAPEHISFVEAQKDNVFWGRLVESTVGTHCINSTLNTGTQIYYWREINKEVDFVLQAGKKLVALEVKSTRSKDVLPGMEAFNKAFKPKRILQIGGQGMSLKEFLSIPATELF